MNAVLVSLRSAASTAARADRFWRPAALSLALVAAGRFALWTTIQSPVDWDLYRSAALRWQAGGSYFLPEQLSGTYTLGHGEVLYPPVALWLLIPFAHLPDLIWWLAPAVLLAAALWRLRPVASWGWCIVAAIAATPAAQGPWLTGRPTIWMPAALAWGLIGGGWAALVLVKPSLLPFALAGLRRRSWWVTAALVALGSLPFGALNLDWITAVRNSGQSVLYSIMDVPLMMIPVVAWAARRQAPREVLDPSPQPQQPLARWAAARRRGMRPGSPQLP